MHPKRKHNSETHPGRSLPMLNRNKHRIQAMSACYLAGSHAMPSVKTRSTPTQVCTLLCFCSELRLIATAGQLGQSRQLGTQRIYINRDGSFHPVIHLTWACSRLPNDPPRLLVGCPAFITSSVSPRYRVLRYRVQPLALQVLHAHPLVLALILLPQR